jgi:hypothetical protein
MISRERQKKGSGDGATRGQGNERHSDAEIRRSRGKERNGDKITNDTETRGDRERAE